MSLIQYQYNSIIITCSIVNVRKCKLNGENQHKLWYFRQKINLNQTQFSYYLDFLFALVRIAFFRVLPAEVSSFL